MSEKDFSEFVKQKAAQNQPPVDWNKTKTKWLKELDGLYRSMEEYLKPFTDTGEIQIERTPIQLREDHLGTYGADRITFKIGSEKIVATPIGTLLIGAWGRVDMSGPRKTLKLVLLSKGGPVFTTRVKYGENVEESSSPLLRGEIAEAGWYIQTPPPQSLVVAFGKDSFRDAIMEVTGG